MDAGVEPTCTTTGKTEGKHCSVCNTVLTEQTELPVIAHTYDDKYDTSCNVCGFIRDAECAHTELETLTATNATCTLPGLTEGKKCKKCGEIVTAQTEVPALGHDEINHETKAPTCTEIGWDAYVTCSRCDYTTYLEKPALGHTEVVDARIEPTCTTVGKTEGKHCLICNTVFVKQTEIPVLGHDEINHEAKAPTCTEIGWDAYVTCSRCDYSTYSEQLATGHTEVVDARVEPTCTSTGKTEGKHCSVCNTVFSEQIEIPKISHTYDDKYDESCNVCGFVRDAECAHTELETIPGKDATCTAPGLTEGERCKKCDEIITAQTEIPSLGHTEVVDARIEPTCTATGKTEGKRCSVCNTVLKEQADIPIVPHTYDDKYDESCNVCGFIRDAECAHTELETLTATAATCTETGLTEGKKCKKCGEIITAQNETPALGHNETNHDAKEPTCTEVGWDAYVKCSRCDYTTYAEKSATGHTEVADERVEPTCTAIGKTEGKHCSVCNTVLTEEKEIPALGHDETNHEAKAPTCTEIGWDAYNVCNRCDYSSYEEKAALGHTLSEPVTEKKPTKKEYGEIRRYCANCDYYEADVLDKIESNQSIPVIVAISSAILGGSAILFISIRIIIKRRSAKH